MRPPFRSSSTARFSELYILGRLRGCGASYDRTDWEHCAKAYYMYSLYLRALAEMSEVFLIFWLSGCDAAPAVSVPCSLKLSSWAPSRCFPSINVDDRRVISGFRAPHSWPSASQSRCRVSRQSLPMRELEERLHAGRGGVVTPVFVQRCSSPSIHPIILVGDHFRTFTIWLVIFYGCLAGSV